VGLWLLRRFQHSLGLSEPIREQSLDSGDEIAQEYSQVIIMFVQRDPGAGGFLRFQPTADQGALAITSRCRYQDQWALAAAIESLSQTRARHQVNWNPWMLRFGLD